MQYDSQLNLNLKNIFFFFLLYIYMYFIYIYYTINIVPYTSVRFRLRCTTCMHKYNLELRFSFLLFFFSYVFLAKVKKTKRFNVSNKYLSFFFKVFLIGFKKNRWLLYAMHMNVYAILEGIWRKKSLFAYMGKIRKAEIFFKKLFWFCIS